MVQGLDKLNARWGAIPGKVRAAVSDEMEKIAQEVVRDMRRGAPKDSGELVRSIDWTWGDVPKGTLTIGTVGGSEYGSLRITIYAGGKNGDGDAFYARFQEFGTVKMPANPFFYPVWRARRRSIKGRITRAINKAIKGL